MEKVAKRVLAILGNTHTKVKEKNEFKGNYYSYITDTIYLSKNYESVQMKKGELNISKVLNELVTICHEAVHSIQNKTLHMLNSIFSNLSIILAATCIMLEVVHKESILINIVALLILVLAIGIRLVLECDAVERSLLVARKAIIEGIIDSVDEN